MTQPIEISNTTPQDVVSAGSRYITQNVIYYGEQRFLTFDLYIRKPYEKTEQEDILVITKGVEYRPDLVSQDYYGFPDNWWRILEANNMKDIYDFKAGVTIILPEIAM
jgi:hypothetical protein